MKSRRSSQGRSLLIVGAGGQAANAFEVSSAMGLEPVGFIDETDLPERASNYLDIPVFSSVSYAATTRDVQYIFVAIGEGWRRAEVTARLRKVHKELEFATLVHPSAVVSRKATVGEGSLVMPGAFVGSGATVGQGVTIGSNAVLAHHCVIGDFVSIFAGASIAGGTRIGDRSAVGLNAAIREKTLVGSDVVVGAQSLVLEDIDDRCVVLGVPGRRVRTRSVEDQYLS